MVSYAHAEKTLNERRKTQSSATVQPHATKGQAVDTVVANKVCAIILIGLRLGGWSLGLTGN